jgi:hypothetical protein
VPPTNAGIVPQIRLWPLIPPFDAGDVLGYSYIPEAVQGGQAVPGAQTCVVWLIVSQLVTGCSWDDNLSATCKGIGEINRPFRIPDEIAEAKRPADEPEALSGGMIYILSLMTIGAGVQAILKLCLRNMRGCNVGITDGRDV